jgi:hypothetical protein
MATPKLPQVEVVSAAEQNMAANADAKKVATAKKLTPTDTSKAASVDTGFAAGTTRVNW